MKSIAITLFIALLFACGTKRNAVKDKSQKTKPVEIEAINVVAETGKIPANSDTLIVQEMFIKGNTLTMTVSYSGGCNEHEFRLVGSQMISKSLPPIRYVKLIHNAKGDACDAMITKRLDFDIRGLAYKQEAGSEIMLNIQGNPEYLKYTYE